MTQRSYGDIHPFLQVNVTHFNYSGSKSFVPGSSSAFGWNLYDFLQKYNINHSWKPENFKNKKKPTNVGGNGPRVQC